MPIHSEAYLNSLIQDAEVAISTEVKCIFYRFSLNIVQGVSTYTLPSGVIGILQVSWLGEGLEPQEYSDFGWSEFFRPQNLSTQGKPRYYMRVGGSGYNKIKFHPTPYESVSADNSSLHNDTGILNRVVVSSWRAAEPQDLEFRLPTYLFRNLMKYYAMTRAYAREGIGQNLIASEYFKAKYFAYLKMYKDTMEKIPQAVQLRFGDGSLVRSRVPRPVMPTSGKWSF